MSEARPKIDPRQEVRFAVVLYGGVSLAIYINGVTQELFRMVRATAEDPEGGAVPLFREGNKPEGSEHRYLEGTEKVYRQIGQLLGGDGRRGEKCRPDTLDPIRTRFVVDVLSGTSAGGINAVYLAKALANDQPIQEIQELWIREGDIEKLINDRGSVEGLGLPVRVPPTSLLNSQRMYHKLLEAFEGMEEKKRSDKDARSPYNDELDLFVTATDISGLPIYFRLSGGIAWEKRHRNVFHFRYDDNNIDDDDEDDHNDFLAKNDPFLAFAARCTSAFPFAFEPMKLTDINRVLVNPLTKTKLKENWEKFFPTYRNLPTALRTNGDNRRYYERDFGDGGYLDNKPFEYATGALANRRSGLPVRRKLLYVEPSPEELEPPVPKKGDNRPNAIENVRAALSLARYETIREDMERILHRNRLNERMRHIVSGMERDLESLPSGFAVRVRGDVYARMDLQQMIRQRCAAYGGYHRLKVASVTDDVSAMIVNAAELEPQSDDFLAVRYLVRAWRQDNYAEYKPDDGPEKKTQNAFLLEYDLSYRIRRLEFVLDRLAQLYSADHRTKKLLASYDKVTKAATKAPLREYMRETKSPEYRKSEEVFRKKLDLLRGTSETRGLRDVLSRLRKAREDLNRVGKQNPIRKAVLDTGLESKKLCEDILGNKALENDQSDPDLDHMSMDDRRLRAAREMLQGERKARFEAVAAYLSEHIKGYTTDAASKCEALLDDKGSVGGGSDPYFPEARDVIRHYYDIYDHYDSTLFPILQSTEQGAEFETVEITRVSPVDCPSIFEEGDGGRRRLAGTALNNFGAFLDRGWRYNDMLWGRLDGAERIITTLLAGTEHENKKDGLIKEAQIRILEEELRLEHQGELLELLVAAINETSQPEDRKEEKLRNLLGKATPINGRLTTALSDLLNGEKLREFLGSKEYKINGVDRKSTTHSLARATTVVGKMLDGISDDFSNAGKRDASKRIAAWVTRFGYLLWGVVEVSVPRSLARDFFRHFVSLFYLFGALLIVASLLLPMLESWKLGLAFIVGAVVAHYATWLLGRYMRGKNLAFRLLKSLPIIAGGFLAAVGAYTLIPDRLWSAFRDALLPESLGNDLRAASGFAQEIEINQFASPTIALFGLLVAAVAFLILAGADRVFGLRPKLWGTVRWGQRTVGSGKRLWRTLEEKTRNGRSRLKERTKNGWNRLTGWWTGTSDGIEQSRNKE